MSNAHTPGPWTATKGRTRWNVRGHLCTVLDTHHGSPEVCEANTKLAAAAPDLLAACEALVERAELGSIYTTDQQTGETFADAIKAAIAKARGST